MVTIFAWHLDKYHKEKINIINQHAKNIFNIIYETETQHYHQINQQHSYFCLHQENKDPSKPKPIFFLCHKVQKYSVS